MIVVDKGKLRFLLAGRSIKVDVTREYKRGRSYAVGTSHKRSVCRALVVDRFEMGEGVWRLTIRQHVDEEPEFLAADPGAIRSDYTKRIAQAARGEPEPVPRAKVRDLSKYRAAADQVRRAETEEERRERIAAELDEAMRSSVSRADRDRFRIALHHVRKAGS